MARLTLTLASAGMILSACGGGGDSSSSGTATSTNNTTNTNSTPVVSTPVVKDYEGTYTVSSGDVAINFKVSTAGTITSCYSDAVYVCNGQVNASGSFTISGNDGETPVDTTATLEGLINATTGTITGSFKANSLTEGPSSGAFTGGRTISGNTSSSSSSSSSSASSSSNASVTAGAATCTQANASLGTGPALTSAPPAPCYKGRLYTFAWTDTGTITDACRGAQSPSLNGDLQFYKAKNVSACYCKPNAKVNGLTMRFVCHVFFDSGL